MDYIQECVKLVTGIQIQDNDELHKVLFVIALTFHDLNKAVENAGMKWEKQKKKKLW